MLKNLFEGLGTWEARSYKTMLLAAIMISLGLLLGGFIKYTVILASVGSFVLLIGIVLYIYSQLIEQKTGSVETQQE